MRLDEVPTSDRIEDRRGLPGGRAGLGIGTVANDIHTLVLCARSCVSKSKRRPL
jgi:hypothetical protein